MLSAAKNLHIEDETIIAFGFFTALSMTAQGFHDA